MSVVSKGDKIQYDPPELIPLMKKSNQLIEMFTKYAALQGLSEEDVVVQHTIIPRILLRVDKREGYFMVFHDQTRINEVKQAALTAYWILKFKPFMISDRDPVLASRHCRINEGFALFYILSALKGCAMLKGITPRPMSQNLVDEIMYAFSYWDLSKEAVILISETIGESIFGIEAQGIK